MSWYPAMTSHPAMSPCRDDLVPAMSWYPAMTPLRREAVKIPLLVQGLCLILLPFLQGCLQDPLSVSGGQTMEIRLRVTGGFAGVDYVLRLDGESGSLVGEACTSFCEFLEGDILRSLSRQELEHVWTLFQEAGIHALDGEDFGYACCDQFHYDVDYRDAEGRSRVKGSSEVLPESLVSALNTLHGMASGASSVIVDFETEPESWSRDPFQIQEAEVSGHTLDLRLAYGGGCRKHELKVVAWGGWMESFPVQVRLFISHEDFDDPCDAWIAADLSFDLTPLKLAYEAAYGVGSAGQTTLVLLLDDPMLASPLGARRLEYEF